MEGRVVQSTAMADEEKILSVKGAKKKHTTQPHTWRNTPHRYKNSKDTQPHNSYGQQDFHPSTHPPPLTIHTSHTCYDDGDDTHNSAITHQALIKISHSPSKRLHSDFFLLFLFLIENENRVFSFEVGKVNVTLRIKRS